MKNKFLILLLIFLCCFSSLVYALDTASTSYDRTTQREMGVFAFFNLGGSLPDYEHWVRGSQHYQGLPEDDKEDFLINETIRLGTGFGKYNSQTSTLHIETAVLVHYTPPKDDKSAVIYFEFPDQNVEYIPTFSYPYGDKEWVSLIINRLALFSKIPLTHEHYEKITKDLTYDGVQYEAILTIEVRPTQADHSKPIKIGNMKQWIMIGEIAYMKCEVESDVTGKTVQLWDFVAPWYAEEYKQKNLPEDLKYPHPFDLKK